MIESVFFLFLVLERGWRAGEHTYSRADGDFPSEVKEAGRSLEKLADVGLRFLSVIQDEILTVDLWAHDLVHELLLGAFDLQISLGTASDNHFLDVLDL